MKIDRAKLDDCVAKMDAVVARTDPPVSEKQRRAMHAAASGNSTLGIPKKVGQEFAEADPGGKLPKSKSDGGPGSGPQKGGGSGPDMRGPVEKRAAETISHAKNQETYHSAKAANYRAKGNEAAANKHQAAASEYKMAGMYPENKTLLRNAKTRAREAGG